MNSPWIPEYAKWSTIVTVHQVQECLYEVLPHDVAPLYEENEWNGNSLNMIFHPSNGNKEKSLHLIL